MNPLVSEGKCARESNDNSSPQGQYLQQYKHKKHFNDPLLPEHIDDNTVFGIETKNKNSILDAIFPDKSLAAEDCCTELYKISHNSYGTGEQLNRRYTGNFDPDYRYGKLLKRLPAGAWFKNNVHLKPPSDGKNIIADQIVKILESENNENCCRYPYIDNRQGKFLGRSYLKVADILTGDEPDEKYYETIDYWSAINKIKRFVKGKGYNLRELRETYKSIDNELTGWLPLEQVYTICYHYQIRPEKKLFDLALNSIQAINENNVCYDLFVDLLDPNVRFAATLKSDKQTKLHEHKTTYKDGYENKVSRDVQLNKHFDPDSVPLSPMRPIVLAHQDCFGSETNVKALLNPTIFSNYGLTHRDFFMKRDKNVMQKLFRDVGVELPNDDFNVVWDNACRRDGFDGEVSVEAFRLALREHESKTIERSRD